MTTISLRQRRADADRKGRVIIAASVVAVTGILTALAATRSPEREPATGCIAGDKIARQTVVIVDRTDRWSSSQASLLYAALMSHARSIDVEDRFTVIGFDGRAERPPAALFDRCKPAATCNIAVCTPSVAEQHFRDNFATPLSEALTAITMPSQAPETHLVAFLSNVAAHLKYEARATTHRIVIYGDMAEHSPTLSVYPRSRTPFSPAIFTQHFNALVRDRLTNIALDITVVPTPSTTPALQRRIKDAWVAALTANAITYSWKDF